MESYWIGTASRDRGIPFLAVRAISDTVDQRLWVPGDLNSSLNGLIWKAASYLFAHPREFSSLLTLVRNLRLTQRYITQFLDLFLRMENLERPGQ
jgi:hypothetical protein